MFFPSEFQLKHNNYRLAVSEFVLPTTLFPWRKKHLERAGIKTRVSCSHSDLSNIGSLGKGYQRAVTILLITWTKALIWKHAAVGVIVGTLPVGTAAVAVIPPPAVAADADLLLRLAGE